MRKIFLMISMVVVLLSPVSSMADNKVIVVPLGKSTQSTMFACVTGAYGRGEPTNGQIIISSQNITVNSPNDVLHTWQSALVFEDDIQWGLRCNDGWVNTGCTASNSGSTIAYDLPQYENGCHSDDDEYYRLIIFTTCCKLVSQ